MSDMSSNKTSSDKLQLFEEQIHPLYQKLYRVIFSIVKNHASTEDVLQNTLIQAFVSLSGLKDDAKLHSWMFTIARNESLSYLRKNRHEIAADPITTANQTILDNCYWMLPDEVLLKNAVHDKVVSIINHLGNKYRDIVILRYYADLTLEEIALVLNLNINTVKSRHMRVKEKIYKELIKSDVLYDLNKPEEGGEGL